MIRALQNNPFTLSTTVYSGSVPTDPVPDAATLGVTRADGTVAVAPGTGASEGGVGIFTYTLTGAQTATLDRLDVTWATSGGKSWKAGLEIVGGYLCLLADLAALYPTETNNELARRRTDIETRLEDACGRAFVPRFERERVTVNRHGKAYLKWGSIRSITSVTAQTFPLTSEQIAALDVDWDLGCIWGMPLSRRHGDVVISYEHGADMATETCEAAMLSAIKETFGPNKVDGRIVSKHVDNVRVDYAHDSTHRVEFTSQDVVSFIENNRRPLVR